MTRDERLKAIETIWKKHATGKMNMICTFLPHANQVAFFQDLLEFFEYEFPYPQDLSLSDVRKAVNEVLKEDSQI